MPAAHTPPKLLAFQLALLTALTPFAIDTYLPAMAQMAQDFDTNVQAMGKTVSSYLLGFALGQLIGGPLSDRYGRKLIAAFGLGFFILCSVQIMLGNNLGDLVQWRFLQAIGGGFATVVVAAIVRDNFSGRESATIFSMIGIIMMVAPLIAPAVGSLILAISDWQSIFLFLIAYAVLLFGVLAIYIPDSPIHSSVSHTEPKSEPAPRPSLTRHFYESYKQVFAQTSAMPHLLGQSLISGILFTFITNAAFILIDYFGVGKNQFSLYFAMIVAGIMLANRLNIHLLSTYPRHKILLVGCSLQMLATVSLAMVTYTTTPSLVMIIAIFTVIIACIGFIFGNNLSLYMDYYPQHSGSANAVFGCSTFLAGSLLGTLSSSFHTGNLIPISTIIACSSVLGSSLLIWKVSKLKSAE